MISLCIKKDVKCNFKFNTLYNDNAFGLVFFILEKPSLLKQLAILRNKALYILSVESCRIKLYSGIYISFHFNDLKLLHEFLKITSENLTGLVLYQHSFLNIALTKFNILLLNFNIQFLLNYLLYSVWYSIKYQLLCITGYIIQFYFIK